MQELELVKACEGFHRVVKGAVPVTASPYICPAGFWTIGFGHVCRQDTTPITLPEAEDLLLQDLAIADHAIAALIRWPLARGQRAALRSWTFNLGAGRLKASTIRAKINRGELDDVPDELRRWVYGGGRKLPGLVARREGEVALWRTG